MIVVAKEDTPELGTVQRLGRLVAIDQRSLSPRFSMSSPPSDRQFRNWLSPAWRDWPSVLDQGSTSQCVAYAANKLLLTHPIVNRPHLSSAQLYHEAQKIDEWEGEAYDGTSVNAGMKALRNLKLIGSWTWAYELEPVVRHILEVGPVVVGTDWTSGMFQTDKAGYIWPTGYNSGGHAYLLVGVNRNRANPDGTKGAVRILNSWGPNWGHGGRAWMSFNTLQTLLNGLSRWPGEAAAVNELQLPR